MNIGFIGLGVMGSIMVKRLLNAGYTVRLFNRSKDKLTPLLELGAIEATSIAEVAQASEVIVTSLSMPEDVEEVYLGKNGIITNAKQEAICIDTTTVGSDTSKYIYKQAKEEGIHYLDAPVSGGPEGAENGTLTIMVGGDSIPYQKVSPLLKELGSHVELLGPSGAGSTTKLINQYLVAVHSLAAAEAVIASRAQGIQTDQLLAILKSSYGDSKILRRHIENFIIPNNFEPGGALKYLLKDLRLANHLHHESGLKEYLGEFVEKRLEQGVSAGHSNLDMSSIYKVLEQEVK